MTSLAKQPHTAWKTYSPQLFICPIRAEMFLRIPGWSLYQNPIKQQDWKWRKMPYMYYKAKLNEWTFQRSSKMCAFSSKQRFPQGWHHLCMQQSVHRVRYLSLHADSCNWHASRTSSLIFKSFQIQQFGRNNVQEFNRRSLWQHGSSARANQRSSPGSVDETCPTRQFVGTNCEHAMRNRSKFQTTSVLIPTE